jgi:hypothetical protein
MLVRRRLQPNRRGRVQYHRQQTYVNTSPEPEYRPAPVQCASAVLLVRPAHFAYNPQTAGSNRMATPAGGGAASGLAALAEFEALHQALRAAGVRCCVVQDTALPPKPDAVFPNNWVSFHADGSLVLYPMCALNRRSERCARILAAVQHQLGFRERRRLDLSERERQGKFLEGTGSLVLDHIGRVAYASRSVRTDESLVMEWATWMGYEPVVFDSCGRDGHPLYHTNVLLSIGARHAIVCSMALSASDRGRVLERLKASGRSIVEISIDALYGFGANILELQVEGPGGRPSGMLVMSARARAALAPAEWEPLRAAVDGVIEVSVPTIETLGGGGIRCMMAEVP